MDTWTFDDQSWQRTPDQRFKLEHFRGLSAPDNLLDTHALAKAVGAHECPEEGDGVLYPGPFKHSPVTGKPLPAAPAEFKQTWLPPFGNGLPSSCLGLRQTALSVDLPSRPKVVADAAAPDPETRLPLPQPGEYHFLVGNLKTRVPWLLAINFRQGRIHLHSGQAWIELKHQEKLLPGSSLPATQWGAWLDEADEKCLYLPTDEGLAILDINVLRATYHLTLTPGHCLGAPTRLDAWIMVPALTPEGRGRILRVARHDDSVADWLDYAAADTGESFNIPLADSRQILWLNARTQARVKLNVDNQPVADRLPWPEGMIPRFEFGGAYQARNGELWQICYDEEAGNYHYVQLGRHNPDQRPCRSPSLTSGTACFVQASPLPGPPWNDTELVNEAATGTVVIPLLEAPGPAVLCARVEWIGGLEALFESLSPLRVHYDWLGHDGDRRLFTHKLAQPWLARPFVYRGWLYLYHPDMTDIPGWQLA
ncbi:hypothetical protein [Methylomagnum sp.]